MYIEKFNPYGEVGSRQYETEKAGGRLALNEACPGHDYFARLVLSGLERKRYAADYWVELTAVRQRRLKLPLSSKFGSARVTITPLLGGEPQKDQAETRWVRSDGTILARHPSLLPPFGREEAGYLTSAIDEPTMEDIFDTTRPARGLFPES